MCISCLVGHCDRCHDSACICWALEHPVLAVRVYQHGQGWAPYAATVSNVLPGQPVWAKYVYTSLN